MIKELTNLYYRGTRIDENILELVSDTYYKHSLIYSCQHTCPNVFRRVFHLIIIPTSMYLMTELFRNYSEKYPVTHLDMYCKISLEDIDDILFNNKCAFDVLFKYGTVRLKYTTGDTSHTTEVKFKDVYTILNEHSGYSLKYCKLYPDSKDKREMQNWINFFKICDTAPDVNIIKRICGIPY